MDHCIIDSELFSKLVTNQSYAQDYYNLFTGYSNSIEKKVKCITDNKANYSNYEQQVYEQVEAHFDKIIANFIEAKNQIKTDLNKNFRNFEKSIGLLIVQADEIKTKIDQEIKKFEQILNQVHDSKLMENNNNFNNDFDDDALQINESVNEFAIDTDDVRTQFEAIFTNIQTYMRQKSETIDEIVDENYELTIHNTEISKFVECSPSLDNQCFGHIEKKIFPKSSLDLLDHTKFNLENENSLTFECNKQSSVTFKCPNTLRNSHEKHEIYPCIAVKLTDALNQSIHTEMKVKETDSQQRFFRAYFNPPTPGKYILSITYNGIHILHSPFFLTAYIKTEHKENHLMELIKPLANKPFNEPNHADNSNQNESKKYSAAGRGRLLQKKHHDTMPISVNSPFSSQKRKSPSFDMNNNKIMQYTLNNCDGNLQELASKFKKVSVDESANVIHDLFEDSVSNSMDVSVDVEKVATFVSDHLRKHAGDKRLPGEVIPNLKAKLVCKYSDLKFPIGVRVCKSRNWVIACESGNNSVKIFDRFSTKLIHELNGNFDKSKPKQEFVFFRPSAVLLDDSAAEIFIKDDKQIQVFDINQNFKIVRKFGSGLLVRPYGLAFNNNRDLVLVDADLRNPQVIVFDRKTGSVISTKPYEPIISSCSKDIHKNSKLFQVNNSPLVPSPIVNTKIRFICTNQDFLYASDLGRSIVFKTDLEGRIKLAFGNPGRAVGQINEPSGIHVDNDGQAIIVGDSKNNRIQIYDGKGVYKCNIEFIGDNKLGRPSDIHLDSEGYLYVSNFTQENIKMFKLVDE